jgi:hypothetical protein
MQYKDNRKKPLKVKGVDINKCEATANGDA